jgi:hypothetical protein
MTPDRETLRAIESRLAPQMLERVHETADLIVSTKERGGSVAVVTGSGPNIHEGATTLIAELIRLKIVDGVTTSSAVVAHELGGTLDKVKRCDGVALGLEKSLLPKGGEFELTQLAEDTFNEIRANMPIDSALMQKLDGAPGKTIIKAAGNLGYPMGLWLEVLSREILVLARGTGRPFEEIAGLGCDNRTMIGAGSQCSVPVLVTIPQLIGGGMTGLCIGDSISVTERATRLANMLAAADVIIESGVALTQEIHDGPFETYTGHGLWSGWQGHHTYSLEGKRLVRIDLDPALERVCAAEREGGSVQSAIADGLPKTKMFNVPFRMEMSGFARHEGSTAIIGDLGVVWPLIAERVAEKLKLDLGFMSYPQDTEPGKQMREWIVREVRPISRRAMLDGMASLGVS